MADNEGADLVAMAARDGVQAAPGERITGVTYVNGTRVYVSDKGGVFAPQGNFYGSYFTLPESARNDPNRSFTGIQATQSGYRISGSDGSGYDFYNDFGQQQNQAAPAAAPAGPTVDPNAPTGAQKDARDRIGQILDGYGLGSLKDSAWGLITNGASDSEVMRNIRESDPYKQRFAGLTQRQTNGFSSMSEGDYINYENQAGAFMRAAGLPASFYDDPTDFANFIGQNVSLNELNQRVTEGYAQVAQADPIVKEQLRTLYGVSDGDLAAYFLDDKRALPAITRSVDASRIAAQGLKTGFGQISAGDAENLAALGISESQAQSGFGQLAASKELFSALPGEGGDNVTLAEQMGAAFTNDAGAQQKISRRAKARAGAFAGGSGFAQTQTGSTLGSAAT